MVVSYSWSWGIYSYVCVPSQIGVLIIYLAIQVVKL